MRDWFRDACEAAGLTVSVDALGTQYALRPGRDMSRAADRLRLASRHPADRRQVRRRPRRPGRAGGDAQPERRRHRDRGTPDGGQLDQRGGLALRPRHDGLGRLCRRVHDRRDPGQARRGRHHRRARPSTPSAIAAAEAVGAREIGAFVELHIEQGPILEAEGKTIGVVEGGQGIMWFDGVITGFESHAGTTPMPRRRDALLGARRSSRSRPSGSPWRTRPPRWRRSARP